jgi:hypothetical protein
MLEIRPALYMPVRKVDSSIFSSLDEPGRSREARELTWEVHGLSMRGFRTGTVQSDVSNHDESAALVLLCRQKRGIRLSLEQNSSAHSLLDRSLSNRETLQDQPVGFVLSDSMTLSTTTSI